MIKMQLPITFVKPVRRGFWPVCEIVPLTILPKGGGLDLLSPPKRGERRVGGIEPETLDLLTPPLSSLGGGEGENKDSIMLHQAREVHPDAIITPSPRPSGERAGVRGNEFESVLAS